MLNLFNTFFKKILELICLQLTRLEKNNIMHFKVTMKERKTQFLFQFNAENFSAVEFRTAPAQGGDGGGVGLYIIF